MTSETLLGNIKGPQGDKGDKGEKGDSGSDASVDVTFDEDTGILTITVE